MPEPSLNQASSSQGRSTALSSAWVENHSKSNFFQDNQNSSPLLKLHSTFNSASTSTQGVSFQNPMRAGKKNKSVAAKQQESLEDLLHDLKKRRSDHDPSLVARVNIICQQMQRLDDGKKGIAFIKIMCIFKKFIKSKLVKI